LENFTPKKYSISEQLNNKDLHGLITERVPKPAGKQVDCDHCHDVEETTTSYNDWSGEEETGTKMVSCYAYEDIPGTHLMKCKVCGYIRRY
jgi:hypothetical protein